jgi:hypothetical protein
MTTALPLIAQQTHTTLALYRLALIEVMAARLWSCDRLAAELRTDTITLKRLMHGYGPHNPNEAMRERWLIEKAEVFLTAYKPGPKPQPTRRIQTPTLEYRR